MNNIMNKKTGEKQETGVNGRQGLENGRLPVGTGGLTPMQTIEVYIFSSVTVGRGGCMLMSFIEKKY